MVSGGIGGGGLLKKPNLINLPVMTLKTACKWKHVTDTHKSDCGLPHSFAKSARMRSNCEFTVKLATALDLEHNCARYVTTAALVL